MKASTISESPAVFIGVRRHASFTCVSYHPQPRTNTAKWRWAVDRKRSSSFSQPVEGEVGLLCQNMPEANHSFLPVSEKRKRTLEGAHQTYRSVPLIVNLYEGVCTEV